MKRWLANRTLRSKGMLVILTPALLLVAVGAAFYTVQARDVVAQSWVNHSRMVEEKLYNILNLVYQAETGKQGMAVTGEQIFMDTPRIAEIKIPDAINQLAQLVKDDPALSQQVGELRILLSTRVATTGVRTNSVEATKAWLLAQKRSIDAIRSKVNDMMASEDVLLESRLRTSHSWIQAGNVLVAVSIALALFGGLFGMWVFTASVLVRTRRLGELAEQLPYATDLELPETSTDELGELSRSLYTAGVTLRTREQEVRDAREFLGAVIESSPVLITRRSNKSGLIYVSENCQHVVGIPVAQLLDAGSMRAFAIESDRTRMTEMMEELYAGKISKGELEITVQTDRIRILQMLMNRLETASDSIVQIHFVDITQTRVAQREVAEREAQLQAIMAASPDGVYVVDQNLALTWMSEGMRNVTGADPAKWIGRNILNGIHPEDRDSFRETLTAVGAGEIELGISRHRVTHANEEELVFEARMRKLDPTGASSEEVLIVARDVTEQVHLVEDLQESRIEALRANAAKSEFLSRMSHELRTPLNAILGFAQLLGMDELESDQHESVQQITRGGRHLLDLINEVLDIARIESGHVALSPEPVLVSDVLVDVLDLVSPLTASRNISIVAPSAGECDEHVLADRQRLKQVLLNLVSNAIKYNRDDGQVRLTCEFTPDGMFGITVSDTGIGIPTANLDRVFVAFDRLGAENSGVEGTGVGLALSLGLVEAMGGRIEVKSTAGVGSTFTVVLPLANVADALVADEELDSNSPSNTSDGVHVEELTVVYIEDNLANLRLVEQIISRRPGIRLVHAMQGQIGLELVVSTKPDLILLDLHLPDMPGEEVLQRLRAEEITADTPIVIVSADATHGKVRHLLELGATGYLTKPFDVQELLDWLDRSQQKNDQSETRSS